MYNKSTVGENMTIIDHTNIYKKYKGQWVILDKSGTKVLSSDKELKKAVEKFHKKYGNVEIPDSLKVPSRLVPYVGSGYEVSVS